MASTEESKEFPAGPDYVPGQWRGISRPWDDLSTMQSEEGLPLSPLGCALQFPSDLWRSLFSFLSLASCWLHLIKIKNHLHIMSCCHLHKKPCLL